jgi:hypothetical protein
MTKSYDEIMKLLEEKGQVPESDAKKIMEEHGALEDEEKKKIAAAIKMKKVLSKSKDDKKDSEKKEDKKEGDEVSFDDYLQALSTLDSDDASEEDKKKAKANKEKYESQ